MGEAIMRLHSSSNLQDQEQLRSAPPIANAGEAGRLIEELSPGEFRSSFDRVPFVFRHRLVGAPTLTLPHLLETIRDASIPPENIYFDVGDVEVDRRWDQVPPSALSVEDLIGRIETAGAWIILRRAETAPQIGRLLEACMAEIRELSGGDWQRNVMVQNAIVFISSPRRIAVYHIDRECNFLLQIQGSKTVSVFDRNDREVLTEEELERFWTVDHNAAQYKEQFQNRARVVELAPGDGVHLPVNCPHWVRNGNEVCISLSVNVQFRDSLRADIYRMNYHLRRAGIIPTPPGKSAARDAAKAAAYRSAARLRKWLGRQS
jgi:Cupin-like domain